jgi:hypothetical protein
MKKAPTMRAPAIVRAIKTDLNDSMFMALERHWVRPPSRKKIA